MVLFPRQELQLRIFEPRYRQMIDDCMLGDGQLGVCLIDPGTTVRGWEAPRNVGTVAKITKCQDVKPDGAQLQIQTVGRSSFMILRLIPPSKPRPADYDPYLPLPDPDGEPGRLYLQAEVQMIPEIDRPITLDRWTGLVDLWKQKVVSQSDSGRIEPHTLDRLLEKYYLVTETPTVDYIYSLSALGSSRPEELQPILEASTLDQLITRVEHLMVA